MKLYHVHISPARGVSRVHYDYYVYAPNIQSVLAWRRIDKDFPLPFWNISVESVPELDNDGRELDTKEYAVRPRKESS